MSAPAVAVSRDGKKFAAAWMDKRLGNGTKKVFWAVANQAIFSSDEPIHSKASGEQDHPSLAFDRTGAAWAVWEESSSGREKIWFRSIAVRPQQLSVTVDGRAYQPVIACNDGVVAVVYESIANRNHSVVCRVLAR